MLLCGSDCSAVRKGCTKGRGGLQKGNNHSNNMKKKPGCKNVESASSCKCGICVIRGNVEKDERGVLDN